MIAGALMAKEKIVINKINPKIVKNEISVLKKLELK